MNRSGKCLKCEAPLAENLCEDFCPGCLFAQAVAAMGNTTPASEVELREVTASQQAAFGDYEILEKIGEGGMGVVYKARQRSLDRVVALKMLSLIGPQARPEMVKRFRAEAIAAASLQHPHIVAIHEVGLNQGRHFYVMDYVAGPSLAKMVGNQPLPPNLAARYLKQIAEAVHYERGILHRDLKPANVLMGVPDQPLVTDFGLAKRLDVDSDLTLTGQVLGSPHYIPPEQARGKPGRLSRRTDVYGLGAILYHLLTGRPPFVGEQMAEILALVLSAEPTPPRLLNPLVPRDLETICLKCLEKEPSSRYPTAQAMAEDLTRCLDGKPIVARPVGALGKTWRWCRRKPALATALVACGLMFGFGFAGVTWQWHRAKASEALMRRNLYAADMNLAQQALAEQNLGLALKILEAHRPKPGEEDFRGWEWRFLWRECQGGELRTLGRHALSAQWVAFSPDGRLLASAAEDSFKLWDVPSGREIASGIHSEQRQEHSRSTIVFSPDGRFLATSGFFNQVRLWEYPVLREIGILVHDAQVRNTAISPDSAVAGTIAGEVLYLWNLASRQLLKRHHIPQASYLAFSVDQRTLAIGTGHGRIVLWDRIARAPRDTIDTHERAVSSVVFGPDGNLLASTTTPGHAQVWNSQNLQLVACFTNHAGWIQSLAFSPDGRLLATAGSDRTIKLWDWARQLEVGVLHGHLNEVWGVAFSPDGQLLASSSKDGEVKLWSIQPKTLPPRSLLLPPHRRYVLSSTADTLLIFTTDSEIQIWDTGSVKETARYPIPVNAKIPGIAVSPRGGLVGLGMSSGEITLWRSDRGVLKQIATLAAHRSDICAMEFTRDGHQLISADTQQVIMVWDVPTASAVASFKPHPSPVLDLGLSADGRIVVTTHGDWTAEVWDAPEQKRLALLGGHAGAMADVAVSRDGKIMATVSFDGTAKLWDVQAGRQLGTLEGQTFGLHSAALSADGQRLAVGGSDGSVKLWDTRLQRSVGTLRHNNVNVWVQQLGFLPDGNALVSVSDETLVVWRAASLAETDRVGH